MLVPSDERVTRHASSQLWSLFTGSTTASKIPSQGAHEDGRAQASLEELARACAHVAHPMSNMSTPICCLHRLTSVVPGPPLPESHRPKSHLKCNSGCRTCTLQFHFASPIPSRKASALERDIKIERDDNRASQLLLLIRHQETHGTPQSARRNGDHVVDRHHTVVVQSVPGTQRNPLDSPFTVLVSGATVTFVITARATSRVRSKTGRVLSSRAKQISRMTQFSTLTLPTVQETRSSRSSVVPSERRICASRSPASRRISRSKAVLTNAALLGAMPSVTARSKKSTMLSGSRTAICLAMNRWYQCASHGVCIRGFPGYAALTPISG